MVRVPRGRVADTVDGAAVRVRRAQRDPRHGDGARRMGARSDRRRDRRDGRAARRRARGGVTRHVDELVRHRPQPQARAEPPVQRRRARRVARRDRALPARDVPGDRARGDRPSTRAGEGVRTRDPLPVAGRRRRWRQEGRRPRHLAPRWRQPAVPADARVRGVDRRRRSAAVARDDQRPRRRQAPQARRSRVARRARAKRGTTRCPSRTRSAPSSSTSSS